MFERLYPLVLALLVTPVVVAAQTSYPQPLAFDTIRTSVGPVRAVHGIVRLQIRKGAMPTLAAVRRLLPGVDVREQILSPERTSLYGANLEKSRPSPQREALHAAEDALTRSFTAFYAGPENPALVASRLMSKHDVIAWAEPIFVDELHATTNDPFVMQQGYLSVIRAFEAWDLYQGDTTMVVAVSDNGVDQLHPDLAPNLHRRTTEIPSNGIDDDNNGVVDDYIGANLAASLDNSTPGVTFVTDPHGTEVAGFVGAATNNGVGIASVGYRNRLFPIRIAVGSDLLFSYQSILYAAQNRFPIVTCSWGIVKPPSPVEQAIIDYARAMGTVVVASAGNHGQRFPLNAQSLNYPSAYDGVFGVGECESNDVMRDESGLGVNADVAAPTFRAISTSLGNSYGSTAGGTSFAAPVAASMIGLIRARYPQLTVQQVESFARRCTVDVRDKNPGLTDGVPGRIDVLKAMTLQPLREPAVDIVSYSLADESGAPVASYRLNTDTRLRLTVAAPLGEARNVWIRVNAATTSTWSVSWSDTDEELGTIPAGGQKVSSDIAFRVTRDNASALLLVAQIFVDGEQTGEQILVINPTPIMHRFANDSLIVDVGIQGAVGATGSRATRQGAGLNVVGKGNILSPSGFFAALGTAKASQAIDDIGAPSDFVSSKPFASGDTTLAVFASPAGDAPNQTGLQVTSRVTFPSRSEPVVVFSYTLKNSSSQAVSGVGAAMLMDWDIGAGGTFNRTEPAPDAVPGGVSEASNAAQSFRRNGLPLAIVVGTSSANPDAIVQSGGSFLNEVIANDRTPAVLGALLTTGLTLQAGNFEGDMAGLHGMRYSGVLQPGDERSFMVVVGVGSTVEEATAHVRRRMANPASIESNVTVQVSVHPNPASTVLTVSNVAENSTLELWSFDGHRYGVLKGSESRVTFDLGSIPVGSYFLRIFDASGITSIPVSILR